MLVGALLVTGCAPGGPGVVARDATTITTPTATTPTASADETIANDPGVRIVKLPNGLTVYLRANDRPGAAGVAGKEQTRRRRGQ